MQRRKHTSYLIRLLHRQCLKINVHEQNINHANVFVVNIFLYWFWYECKIKFHFDIVQIARIV